MFMTVTRALEVENTIGVKEPCSTSWILWSYALYFYRQMEAGGGGKTW